MLCLEIVILSAHVQVQGHWKITRGGAVIGWVMKDMQQAKCFCMKLKIGAYFGPTYICVCIKHQGPRTSLTFKSGVASCPASNGPALS